MMRILVLGTSNSRMRGGWLDGFKQILPEAEIENFSVGASPCIQFSAHMKRDFSSFDYVFVDSTPNDEIFVNMKKKNNEPLFTLSYFDKIMRDIFSTICSQTNLVVLGIPRRDQYSPFSAAYKSRKALTESFGAIFIDFGSKILGYAQEHGLNIDECYEDHPAHPLRTISFDIGASIAQKAVAGELENKISDTSDQSQKFRVYTPSDWPSFPIEQRENSIMRETFSLLRHGDSIKFQESLCLGYYINIKNTYCAATLQDESGKSLFRTRLYYPKSDDGLQKLFIPIPEGIKSSRIICGGETDADTTGAQPQQYDVDRKDFVLSISQLCVIRSQ